ELRTPLTSLRGNVAYIARHGATADVIAELERDADRLALLADDLLVLSREESGERPPDDPVDVSALRTAPARREGIDAALAEDISVRGDRAALERAVENLVQNARKYGPPAGRITVKAAGTDGLVRLTVTDEGRGLQPYEADQAFRRFWRGRNRGDGSGLGLPIVRAIAERHGGRAYAEGATFTIELPRLSEISQDPSVQQRP